MERVAGNDERAWVSYLEECPKHYGSDYMETSNWRTMARCTARTLSMEDGVQPLQSLGKERALGNFFFAIRGEVDTERSFCDGSYVRAHQHASGARRGEERAIGMSRGGRTTKIHIAADAHGKPIDLEITGGDVHDAKIADKIIEKIGQAEHFIADKGYDSDAIRDRARKAGMNPVIPRKSNSKKQNPEFDPSLYKLRHLVENLFARLKHFRSVATRFEKLARNFKSIVFVACSLIWLKLLVRSH